ncbi:MAG: tRNA lysidine(34) synthetase TilS [Oscillospiraceae bacterium]|jgi:tRNA(Ile)-lysidine synthase|nr:tRNA lysidine(34) synthetase TilS [Oscillospiraceae bacterium]
MTRENTRESGRQAGGLPKFVPDIESGVTLVAAVSGGPDSVAMLHMFAGARHTVVAAHYNHGLRPAADDDEVFVRGLCEEMGVRFVAGRGDVAGEAARRKWGIEETAREMRYAFLERARAETGMDRIATAHTADDNAETVLLNLTRGAGLPGLCGIPYRRGHIVRPLLRFSRIEVMRYLSERDIPYREDESNRDTSYRRNFIRHEVIPALRQVNPALTGAVNRLTELLGGDEAYLSSLALEEYRQYGESNRFSAKRLAGLPRPVASRVCRLLFSEVSPYPPERLHVEAMLDIAAGGNGRRRDLSGKITVEKKRNHVIIYRKT